MEKTTFTEKQVTKAFSIFVAAINGVNSDEMREDFESLPDKLQCILVGAAAANKEVQLFCKITNLSK